MLFGQDLTSLAFSFMIAVAVGGMAIAVLFPMFSNNSSKNRLKAVATGKKVESGNNALRNRFNEDQKDSRRRQIQDSLKQVGKRQQEAKKRVNLRTMLAQAGLDVTVRAFWITSIVVGCVFGLAAVVFGVPLFVCVGITFFGLFGFPRWVLKFLRNRRQNIFLNDFADAIDVMVRGLKSGLPVSEALKIIATESGEPVGPEFSEVVEGQRVGISIDQGFERMFERIPLPEVNFLAIVMTIQSKTGGNLSEALGNLSRVLRDRKKMKQKVRAVSQEAKASAGVIGSLPFFMMGALSVLNPTYLSPLFTTQTGHICLIGSGIWMVSGILIMKKMINFQM